MEAPAPLTIQVNAAMGWPFAGPPWHCD